MMKTAGIWAKTGIALGAATLVGVGLSGCGLVDSIKNSTADAWSVTYAVTVTGEGTPSLPAVTFGEAKTRGEDTVTKDLPNLPLVADPATPGSSRWEKTVMVTATRPASIVATPGEGQRATCQILLDGKRQIAAVAGEPGKPVTCEATTPKFD
ncbi:hypothetical protein [Mycetocola sp. JXN-3]|uniref:hypothetical protein n=1 Tax=Mycetocola sp. JXN-3 TaxID=2116510 RepID=UPI00165CEF95|nr:hypothetical protein [Mycetocola sp. JXN-3]